MKVYFDETVDISKGGKKLPDKLSMKVIKNCIHFQKEVVFSKIHGQKYMMRHKLRKLDENYIQKSLIDIPR